MLTRPGRARVIAGRQTWNTRLQTDNLHRAYGRLGIAAQRRRHCHHSSEPPFVTSGPRASCLSRPSSNCPVPVFESCAAEALGKPIVNPAPTAEQLAVATALIKKRITTVRGRRHHNLELWTDRSAGRAAREDRARLDIYRPSPCPPARVDGTALFPSSTPGAFIGHQAPVP
jgi:hypothetical protein